VAGTFAIGMVDFDGSWTFVALPEARRVFDLADDAATGVEARLADARILDAPVVTRALQEDLGPDYLVRDWIDLNAPLFHALAQERRVTTLIVFCITIVAGLGVLTRLMVTVLTRAPEIAILRALGASRAAIGRIFVLEGLAIGSAGCVAGTTAGLLLCLVLAHSDIDLGVDFNGQTRIPVQVEPGEVAAVIGSALLVCLAATLYPAWRAAGLDPVEGLQGR
jgi:lipoprotein-releasing system permease protein